MAVLIADWGDCRRGVCNPAVSRHRAPSIPAFVFGFGISANSGAEHTCRELPGWNLRSFGAVQFGASQFRLR
eukprot:15482954-Alexandrium_andersonii.AAC.1